MNKLTVFLTKHFVKKLLNESYINVNHGHAIRHILGAILETQQQAFREDNEVTAVDFIVEQLVRVSKLKPSWEYYQKLRPGTVLCPECKGNRVQKCGKCECKTCFGTGVEDAYKR